MNDRVVAFELNADRSNAFAAGSTRPTPSQRPHRPRHTRRAMTRAQRASVYAADLLEDIQIAASWGWTKSQPMGLTTGVETASENTAAIWPALALMTSDQVVLVLSQSDTTLEVYDTTCPDNRAAAHWFWGEFPHYRRQFFEVAAGSAVANLLAVAVALFSLQVYDRAIPHQSEPTLWVLALGALIAVLMEGILKMARSGLMDITGRRVELTVQSRLMH